MDFITAFFGRFHPLVVHLPIGILLLAFLFECLSLSRNYKGLKKAVQPTLFWGSMFAIAAAVSGYFLRQEGGYEEELADLHQNFGIATAVLSLGVYVLRRRCKYWINDPIRRKQMRILLFVPLVIFLSLTGHWGGSLTHGEDYLFAVLSSRGQHPLDPATKIRSISNIPDAVLYDDVIEPILEARCYDCHSATKEKGDLRLDKVEYIVRGGENGKVISKGPADSSALFKRLMLPIEHDDHMPPGEKPQLSSSEIALIKYWLEEEAHFERPISQFVNSQKISAIIESLQQAPRQSWIPTEMVDVTNEEALRKLGELGIKPVPLAAGNNHLMVSFADIRNITDEHINTLKEIKDQLVWLNLSYTAITDAQLDGISGLSNLRVLYLNYTGISDAGLEKISGLTELRLLSLVGTGISDSSIRTLEKLKHLTKLFLYQTTLSDDAIRAFSEAHKEIELDTGNYRLKELPSDTIVYKNVNSKK